MNDGALARSPASATNSSPLSTKEAGTSTGGASRRPARACIETSTIEQIAVTTSMTGRNVTSWEVRNNASRVALPPTYCAVTAAARPGERP